MSATRGVDALSWTDATAAGAVSVVMAATGGRLESLHAVSCTRSAVAINRLAMCIVFKEKEKEIFRTTYSLDLLIVLLIYDISLQPLPPRMVAGVQFAQALARHVRVNGGRRNIGVAEQQLHHPQICTMVEQMGRERVAQGMR